jgi:hypothetical protein
VQGYVPAFFHLWKPFVPIRLGRFIGMVGVDEQKIYWQIKRLAHLETQTLKENKILNAFAPPM